MATHSSSALPTSWTRMAKERPGRMFLWPQGQKPFQCGFCDVTFDIVKELDIHVKIHLSTNPYKCGYCKIGFRTDSSLTVHVETHKVFVCVPQGTPTSETDSASVLNHLGSSDVRKSLAVQGIEDGYYVQMDSGVQDTLTVSGVQIRHSASCAQVDSGTVSGQSCSGAGEDDHSSTVELDKEPHDQTYVLPADKGEVYPSASQLPCEDDHNGELVVKIEPSDSPTWLEAESEQPTPVFMTSVDNRHQNVDSFGTGDSGSLEMAVESVNHTENVCDDENAYRQEHMDTAPAQEHAELAESKEQVLAEIKRIMGINSETHVTHQSPGFRHLSVGKEEEIPEENISHTEDDQSLLFRDTVGNFSSVRPLAQTLPSCMTDPASSSELIGTQHYQSALSSVKKEEDMPVFFVEGDQHPQHSDCAEEKTLKAFLCSLCGLGFDNPKLVGEHFRSGHRVGKDQIVLFASDQGHSASVGETATGCGDDGHAACGSAAQSERFKCSICEFPFKFCQDLIEHTVMTHGGNDLRPFVCGLCRRAFKESRKLGSHFEVVHGSGVGRKKQSKASKSVQNPAHDVQQHADLSSSTAGSVPESTESADVCKVSEGTDHLPSADIASQSDNRNERKVSTSLQESSQDEEAGMQSTAPCEADSAAEAEPTISDHDQLDLQSMGRKEDQCSNPHGNGQYHQPLSQEGNGISKPFICSFCRERFEDHKHVGHHFRSVHKNDRNLAILISDRKCPETEPVTSGDDGGQHPSFSKLFRCYVCEKVFKLRHDLSRHILTGHSVGDIRVYECGVCGYKSKKGDYLRIHVTQLHGSNLSDCHQCLNCGKKFGALYRLNRHSKSCVFPRDFQKKPSGPAGQGGKADPPADLNNTTVSDRKKEKVSTNCGIEKKKEVGTNSGIDRKKEVSANSGIQKKKEVSTNSGIEKKKEKVSTNSGIEKKKEVSTNSGIEKKKRICHICGKILTRSLQTHIRRHHSDERPYQCHLCPKAFKYGSVLKNHMRFHTKEKRFVCDICGKAFAAQYTVQMHKNTHTNERPFKCDVCGRGFNASSGLAVHRLTHNQDKRHSCDACEMRFYTTGALKKHALTHTRLRPHTCEQCDKTFRSWSNLKRHREQCHEMTPDSA